MLSAVMLAPHKRKHKYRTDGYAKPKSDSIDSLILDCQVEGNMPYGSEYLLDDIHAA